MWKVSWLYEKVHKFLVVPLYYMQCFIKLLKVPPTLTILYHKYFTLDITGSGLVGGAVGGGLFLLFIIALLLIVIIVLLYRNTKSKGQLAITDNTVAYTVGDQDQGANVIINPNPSYIPSKRESNVYSAGPDGDYEEIGQGSMVVCNPAFDDASGSGYVINAIDYTRPKFETNNTYDYSYVRKV